MGQKRTSDQSNALYQKLRDGDAKGVMKACAEATTPDERSNLIPTVHDDTILHMAIYMGKESIALEIIDICRQNDELLTKPNKFGNTALHEAVAAGYEGVVKKLLEKAPDLLSKPNKNGEMPLYTAAHFGHKGIFVSLKNIIKDGHDLPYPPWCSLYKEKDRAFSYDRQHIRSTILHAAIHAEFFELAFWIAKQDEYEKIVQLTDENSMTPLQLLASNSSAFKSGMKCGPIKKFIYNCAPYEGPKCNKKENEGSKKEYDHGQNSNDDSPKRCATRSFRVISSVNKSVWKVLRAWSTMRDIHDQKKSHGLASELARFLIKADYSWDTTRIMQEGVIGTAPGVGVIGTAPGVGSDSENSYETQIIPPSREKYNPPIPLLIAIEHGIFEIVKETLDVHKAAYEYRNTKKQNILHLSIIHRQCKIFDLVKQMDKDKTEKNRLSRQLDEHSFTALHHVGNMDYYNGGTQRGPALQLQEELKWFEDVEELMPPHYTNFLARDNDKDTTLQTFHKRYVEILEALSVNIDVDEMKTSEDYQKKKETPRDYFIRTHDPLLKSAQEWLKRTSESCSTVAGLMATVAFTAAFTVPGGTDDESGTPVLLGNPFFLVFIITDALSLASSLTSLVLFLSILTSPFELRDFRHSLPRKLIFGFTFLFFSVVVTMLAFASTLMLTIPMKNGITKTFMYCVAFVPVTMFALLQFPLWVAFKRSLQAMQSAWHCIFPTHSKKNAKTQ